MNVRDKILNAFEPDGTPEVGAVPAYEGIFIRDHWASFTDVPWWVRHGGPVEQEVDWVRDLVRATGLEWLSVYDLLGAEDALTHSVFSGEHRGNWEGTAEWMSRWLSDEGREN